MLMKRILGLTVVCAGLAVGPYAASATPLSGSAMQAGTAPDTLIEKAWHSGLPHRRVIGDRVYGGRCPPGGCPLWTQRDITPDPITGKYRWSGAPPGSAWGYGTYAAPGGGYAYYHPRPRYYRPYRSYYRYGW